MRNYLLVAALVLSTSVNATTIDTTSYWDGRSFALPFGEPAAATIGQTFTVGTDNQLDNFTFFTASLGGTNDFEAYVMAWDGTKATGSFLYQSGSMTATNNGGAGGIESFTINTGGVTLASGNQYVFFFSASNLFDGTEGASKVPVVTDVYSGGNYVFFDNGSNFSLLTTDAWNQVHKNRDMSFIMNFSSPVPIPSAVWLFGSGLIGLIGFARRRQ